MRSERVAFVLSMEMGKFKPKMRFKSFHFSLITREAKDDRIN
jgi:hypothetical protein